MKFQAFHVNPGEKLKKKDVNNDLSNFMSVFPTKYIVYMYLHKSRKCFVNCWKSITKINQFAIQLL